MKILQVHCLDVGYEDRILLEAIHTGLERHLFEVHTVICDPKCRLPSNQWTRIPLSHTIPSLSDTSPRSFWKYPEQQILLLQGELYQGLKNVFLQEQPDLVIAHHLWNSTDLVSKLSTDPDFGPVPYIAIVHGPDVRRAIDWKNKFGKWAEHSLNKATQVVCVSESLMDALRALKDRNIWLLPPSNDPEVAPYSNQSTKQSRLILTTGDISQSNQLEMLIRVFTKFPHLHLYWIGEGEPPSDTPGNITFIRNARPEEIRRYFKICGYFIFCSEEESLGINLRNAMRAGCIPLTTPGVLDEISISYYCRQNEFSNQSELETILSGILVPPPRSLWQRLWSFLNDDPPESPAVVSFEAFCYSRIQAGNQWDYFVDILSSIIHITYKLGL